MPKLPKRVRQGITDVGALIGSVISDSELPDLDAGERLVNDAVRLNDFQDWLEGTDVVSDDVKAKVGEILDDANRIFPAEPGKQLDYLTEAVSREALDDFAETGYDLSTIDGLSVPLDPALPGAEDAPGAGDTQTGAGDTAAPVPQAQAAPAASPEPVHAAEAAPGSPDAGRPPTGPDDAPAADAARAPEPPAPATAAATAKDAAPAPPIPAVGASPPERQSAAGPPPPAASDTPAPAAPPAEVPPEPQPR